MTMAPDFIPDNAVDAPDFIPETPSPVASAPDFIPDAPAPIPAPPAPRIPEGPTFEKGGMQYAVSPDPANNQYYRINPTTNEVYYFPDTKAYAAEAGLGPAPGTPAPTQPTVGQRLAGGLTGLYSNPSSLIPFVGAKNFVEGANAPQEALAPKPNQGVYADMGSSVAKGVVGAASNVASAIDMETNAPTSSGAPAVTSNTFFRELADNLRPAAQEIPTSDAMNAGEWYNNPRKLAGNVAESVPSTAAILGATAANPKAGMALGYAMAAGNTYEDAREFYQKQGNPRADEFARAEAVTVGAIVSALERVGAESILSKYTGQIQGAVRRRIMGLGTAAAGEGLTEGAQQSVEIVARAARDEEMRKKLASGDKEAWGGVLSEIGQASTAGAIMGTGFAAPSVLRGDGAKPAETPATNGTPTPVDDATIGKVVRENPNLTGAEAEAVAKLRAEKSQPPAVQPTGEPKPTPNTVASETAAGAIAKTPSDTKPATPFQSRGQIADVRNAEWDAATPVDRDAIAFERQNQADSDELNARMRFESQVKGATQETPNERGQPGRDASGAGVRATGVDVRGDNGNAAVRPVEEPVRDTPVQDGEGAANNLTSVTFNNQPYTVTQKPGVVILTDSQGRQVNMPPTKYRQRVASGEIVEGNPSPTPQSQESTPIASEQPDRSHLNALEEGRMRAITRLAEAKKDDEKRIRSLNVKQFDKEIESERKFLGLPPEAPMTDMTDDELMAGLAGETDTNTPATPRATDTGRVDGNVEGWKGQTQTPPKALPTRHVAIYNGKEVEAASFKDAATRVSGNLKTGEHGYVRTPEGKLYEVSTDKKLATPVEKMRTKQEREIAALEERVAKAGSPREKEVLTKRLNEMKGQPSPAPQPAPSETRTQSSDKGKEPWEMTREEYDADIKARRSEIGLYSPAKRAEMHSDAVTKAVREGKPVPSNVLKDYPDLAPKPAPASHSPSSLRPKSRDELRAILKAMDADTSGTKAVLAGRILSLQASAKKAEADYKRQKSKAEGVTKDKAPAGKWTIERMSETLVNAYDGTNNITSQIESLRNAVQNEERGINPDDLERFSKSEQAILRDFVSEEGASNSPLSNADINMILDASNTEKRLELAKDWAKNGGDSSLQFMAWMLDNRTRTQKELVSLGNPEDLLGKTFTINGEPFHIEIDENDVVTLVDGTVEFPYADAISADGKIPVDKGSVKDALDDPFGDVRGEETPAVKTSGPQIGLLGERFDGSGIGSTTGSMFGRGSDVPASATDTPAFVKTGDAKTDKEDAKIAKKFASVPTMDMFGKDSPIAGASVTGGVDAPIDLSTAQRLARPILNQFKNRSITIHESEIDAPDDIFNAIRSAGALGEVRGLVTKSGEIHIFADNIESETELKETILEELLHFGTSHTMDPAKAAFAAKYIEQNAPEVVKAVQRSYPKSQWLDEYFANFAKKFASIEPPTWWKRVMNLVRDAWRKLTGKSYTDAEIMAKMVDAAMSKARTAEAGVGRGTGMEAMSIGPQSEYHYLYPKPRGGWTKEKIKRALRGVTTKFLGKSLSREIARFDSPEEFKQHIYYHGSGGYASGGLKPSISIPVRELGMAGGGYGEQYWAISVSRSKEKASNFTGNSRSGSLYPIILRKGAKVVDMPQISDAAELDDVIEQLWNDKVDAVRIGDWSNPNSEEELAIINPNAAIRYDKTQHYPVYGKEKFNNLTDEQIAEIYNKAKQNLPILDEARKLPRAEAEQKREEIQDFQFSKKLPSIITIDDTPRPTTNSSGQPIHPTEEGVRNFWKWFGDSAVVDGQGRPMVVKHQTNKRFNKFNLRKGAQQIAWFTSDYEAIANNETGAAGAGVVMDLYAKIEKPAEWKEYDNLTLDELEQRGYDGVILRNRDGTFDGFIFDAKQLKSATGNSGQFSPDDADIRMSKKDDRKINLSDKLSREAAAAKAAGKTPIQAIKSDQPGLSKEKIILTASDAIRRLMRAKEEGARMGMWEMQDYQKKFIAAAKVLPTEERNKFLGYLTGITNAKTYYERLPKIAEVFTAYEKREAVQRVRDALKEARTEKLRPEYQSKFDAITANLDPSKMTDSTKAKAQSMADYLQAEPDAVENLPASAKELLARLDKESLDSFSIEQLRDMENTIKGILHHNEMKNSMIVRGKVRSFVSDVNAIAGVDSGGIDGPHSMQGEFDKHGEDLPDVPATPGKASRAGNPNVIRRFLLTTAGVDTVLKWISGKGKFFERLYSDLTYAKEDYHALADELGTEKQALLDKHKMTRMKLVDWRKAPRMVTLSSGETEFTGPELAVIYALTKNITSYERMLNNGIERKRFENRGNKIVKLQHSDIAKIEAALTPFEREFADMAIRHYNESALSKAMKKTAVDVLGYDPFIEEQYFPLSINRSYQQMSIKDLVNLFSTGGRDALIKEGFLNERVQHSNPVIIGDFWDVYHQHTAKAINYATMQVPVKNAMMLLGNPSVGGKIVAKYGNKTLERFRDHLLEAYGQGRAATGELDNVYRRLSRNVNSAILGLRRTTILNNLFGGFTDLSTRMPLADRPAMAKNFIIMANPAMSMRTAEELFKYSKTLKSRYNHDALRLGAFADPEAYGELSNSKTAEVLRGVREFGLTPMELAERQGVLAAWKTLKDKALAEGKSLDDVGTDLGVTLAEMVRGTQNPMDSLNSSTFGRWVRGNPFVSPVFAFTSQISRTRDAIMDDMISVSRGEMDKKTFAANIASRSLTVLVMPAIFSALIASMNRGFTEEEEKKRKDWKDYVARGIKDVATLIHPSVGIAVETAIGIANGTQGKAMGETPIGRTASNVVRFTSTLVNGEDLDAEKVYKASAGLLRAAAAFAGIPLDDPLAVVEGAVRAARGTPADRRVDNAIKLWKDSTDAKEQGKERAKALRGVVSAAVSEPDALKARIEAYAVTTTGKDPYQSLITSIHSMHPLAAIPRGEKGEPRKQFLNSLNPTQRKAFDESVNQYESIRKSVLSAIPPEYRILSEANAAHRAMDASKYGYGEKLSRDEETRLRRTISLAGRISEIKGKVRDGKLSEARAREMLDRIAEATGNPE